MKYIVAFKVIKPVDGQVQCNCALLDYCSEGQSEMLSFAILMSPCFNINTMMKLL